MNRYKYSSTSPTFTALTVGEILKHRSSTDVFGLVESISPNIRIIYGRPVNGSFVRGSLLEGFDEDWIDFDDVEDLGYTFYVPKVYS